MNGFVGQRLHPRVKLCGTYVGVLSMTMVSRIFQKAIPAVDNLHPLDRRESDAHQHKIVCVFLHCRITKSNQYLLW
jgi:hypothetical protein